MSYPIHDLCIRPLDMMQDPEGSRLEVLRYSDHLLRRFGLAEVVFVKTGQVRPAMLREVADEVWALVEGSVQFSWKDRRSSSPTRGATYEHYCDQPTLVLAPFGVEFEVRAVDGPAHLLRIATHENDEE
ncbi:MAG: hypothetical protein BMS9Abin28_0533 [Anaerolineae bacterium]|nr:MAG: hypothetical protein BMS9Abin28_0533 [Anaerolineae bacterium]